MPTTTRPELSKKNEYYLEKHRYYELKHFCLQYHIWKKASVALDGLSKRPDDLIAISRTNKVNDPTAKCVEARDYYLERIKMVEDAAKATDEFLSGYILKAVTEGRTYENLRSVHNIPIGREAYYKLYRKFFWILSKIRD